MKYGAHNGRIKLNEAALEVATDEALWGASYDKEDYEATKQLIGRAITAYLIHLKEIQGKNPV